MDEWFRYVDDFETLCKTVMVNRGFLLDQELDPSSRDPLSFADQQVEITGIFRCKGDKPNATSEYFWEELKMSTHSYIVISPTQKQRFLPINVYHTKANYVTYSK